MSTAPGKFVTDVANLIGLSPEQCQPYVPAEAWQLRNRLWQGKARSHRFAVGFAFLPDASHTETAVRNSLERLAPPPGGFEAVAIVARGASGDWHITKVVEKEGSPIGVQLKPHFPELEIVPVAGPRIARPQIKTGPKLENQADDLMRHLNGFPNVILQGPPGTGKSFLAQRACEIASGAQDVSPYQLSALMKAVDGKIKALVESDWIADLPLVWERVQLHPGYAYDDFVRGRIMASDEHGSRIDSADRVMPQICAISQARGTKPTILILEELNRCSLASVLGDLIVAIDPGHRGEAVHLQIPPPSDGGAGIGALLAVPPGLKVLGTMNTADRSIALVDFAIRRRFRFLDVLPDRGIVEEYYEVRGAADEGRKACEIFDKISAMVSDERMQLGQSYFLCPPGEGWAARLADRIFYEVFPMLREYMAEGIRLNSAVLDLGVGQLDVARSNCDPLEPSGRDLLVLYLTGK
jgi:5-methylcytosine-specific restriction enzyme B